MAPALSVVIPTHKRPQTLERCLQHLEAQTVRDRLEVIVVSDGPDAATERVCSPSKWRVAIRFLAIPKQQQGIARNRGVDLAITPHCLFIGDDIFLAPECCEQHLLAHAALELLHEGPVAVLGSIVWDPSLPMTPVMRWLDRTGWQFGFRMIEKYAEDFVPRTLQHRFTYTSHLSLPTVIAKAVRFREDVSLYGWEDIEWGMRLRDAGIPLFYEPAAEAVHHHPMTLAQSLQRMETLGRSAVLLRRAVPDLDRVPTGWKTWAYRALSLLPTMRGKHAKAFLQGIDAARVRRIRNAKANQT